MVNRVNPVAVGYATQKPQWDTLWDNMLEIADDRANGRLAADLTKNNDTTFADATGLSFPIAASEIWACRFTLFYNSPGTADVKFTLTGPAAPTLVRFGAGWAGGDSGFGVRTAFGDLVDLSSFGNEGMGELIGIIRNGANAGTVQLQFAQAAAVASNSILRAGSYLIATRIS